jgi:hypothetical protein
MNTLAIVGIIVACMLLGGAVWCIVAINHPRTPEEEQAQWEQDLKDFDADMARRGKK